jgi:hypothetical protein
MQLTSLMNNLSNEIYPVVINDSKTLARSCLDELFSAEPSFQQQIFIIFLNQNLRTRRKSVNAQFNRLSTQKYA